MTPPRPTLPSQAYSPPALPLRLFHTTRPTPPPRLLYTSCSVSLAASGHACKAYWQAYTTTTSFLVHRPNVGDKTHIHALSTGCRPAFLSIIMSIILYSNFRNLEASFNSIPLHHHSSPRPTAPSLPPGLWLSASLAPTKPHTPSDPLPRITVMRRPASHYSHSIGRVFQLAYGTTLLSPATPTEPGFSHMNQDYAQPYSLLVKVQY